MNGPVLPLALDGAAVRAAVALQDAAWHYELAVAAAACADYRTAEAHLLHALDVQPGWPEAEHQLGVVFHRQGRYEEAAACYLNAVSHDPGCIEAHVDLGNLLQSQGIVEGALNCYRTALRLDPAFPDLHRQCGNVLRSLGRMHEALMHYAQGIVLAPQDAQLHADMGLALQLEGRLTEAMQAYRCALGIDPENWMFLYCAGSLQLQQGHAEEARALLKRAHVLQPSNADVWLTLGEALYRLDRKDEALSAFQQALSLASHPSQSLVLNCALVLEDLGRPREALPYYEQARRNDPGSPKVLHQEGLLRLLLGDRERGWQGYESRFAVDDAPTRDRVYDVARWSGEDLRGGKLFLWGEQGVGDEVMFCGAIPQLLADGIDCILECDARLQPLFARSFPSVQVIAKSQESLRRAPAGASAHLPVGSLPRLLEMRTRDASYLVADEAQPYCLPAHLPKPCLTVGLAWRTMNRTTGLRRSMALESLKALFAVEDVRWASLQYGNPAELKEEVHQAGTPLLVDESVDQFVSLDAFAAQIRAMDLVITIDNSTAHLAGALGVPVWLMLPYAPDWRWQLEGDRTPWYPSMRIYRQRALGEWRSVIEEIAQDLSATVTGKRASVVDALDHHIG